jgi:hypothetical protein
VLTDHTVFRAPLLRPLTVAYVGLAVPSAEMVNNAAGMVIFPLTFVANTSRQPPDTQRPQ